MSDRKRICILGGGFGGLYTALALDRLPWMPQDRPDIVLVDQRDRFVFLPLLYELVTGELESWEVAPPYTELLAGTNIRFQPAEVAEIGIDPAEVRLTDHSTIAYDYLVLALGGKTPLDIVPGAEAYAIPFHDISHAYRLEEALRELEQSNADKIRVAIAGAGYSGVELACKLADRLGKRGRVRLIDFGEEILTTAPEFNRNAAYKALSDRGVWLDLETAVTEVGDKTISLKYRDQVDTIPAEIVLWTVGTRVADQVRSLPIPKNERDRVRVEPTLQVIDHPNIFALGDLADCKDAAGQQVPITAQAALQQADYTAWNLWAAITGNRPLLPFRYQHLGEMMALGTDNATLTGLGLKFDGTAAYVARRLAYLYRMPTLGHQLRVGLNWIGQPLRSLLSTSVDKETQR